MGAGSLGATLTQGDYCIGRGASCSWGSGERSLIVVKATPVAAKLGFKSNCFPSWSPLEQEPVAAGAQQPQFTHASGRSSPRAPAQLGEVPAPGGFDPVVLGVHAIHHPNARCHQLLVIYCK